MHETTFRAYAKEIYAGNWIHLQAAINHFDTVTLEFIKDLNLTLVSVARLLEIGRQEVRLTLLSKFIKTI